MVVMASPMFGFLGALGALSPVMRIAFVIFGGEVGVIVFVVMIARQRHVQRREQGCGDEADFDKHFHGVSLNQDLHLQN